MWGFMHKRGDLSAEQVIILQLAGTRLRKRGGRRKGSGRKGKEVGESNDKGRKGIGTKNRGK